MPTAPNLEPHDVTVRESTQISLTGAGRRMTYLTFFVGPHGPFIREMPSSEATAERLQAEIDEQTQKLRALLAPRL